MQDRLSEVKRHFEELANQLTDPQVLSDNAKYRALTKEYKNLTPIVEAYDACQAARAERLTEETQAARRRLQTRLMQQSRTAAEYRALCRRFLPDGEET